MAVRGVGGPILDSLPLDHVYEIRDEAGDEALEGGRVAAQDELVDDPRLVELLDHCNAYSPRRPGTRYARARGIVASRYPPRTPRDFVPSFVREGEVRNDKGEKTEQVFTARPFARYPLAYRSRLQSCTPSRCRLSTDPLERTLTRNSVFCIS